MKKTASLLCITGLTFSMTGKAELNENFSLTGFVAPTAIHTTDNNFFGNTDDNVSFNYMEIGLLGRYEFTDKLSFVAEGLYKGVGESKNGLDLDFAFIDYTYYQDFTHSLGARAGIIKIPFGFHNDTRDAPFARNRIFLPQSIYFENFRDSIFSQKGAELRGEHFFDWGGIDWNLGLTKSNSNDEEVETIYENATDLADFSGDDSGYVRLLYTSPSSKFRTGISYTQLRYYLDTKAPMLFSSGQSIYERFLYSFEYAFTPKISLMAEAEYFNWDFSELNSPAIEGNEGIGYYVQLNYRLNQQWDMFISREATYNDIDDLRGREFAKNDPFGTPAYQMYTESVSAGVGYQPNPDWLFRLEYSNHEGATILPGQFREEPYEKYWDMIAFQASYRFDLF